MSRPLAEQVVVLTGAVTAIGREVAVLLGRSGASVVLASRDEEALREVVREVEAAGGRALAVVTDMADGPQVERLADAAVERFGRIDTWVNEPEVTPGGPVATSGIAEIERVFRVNVLGTIHGVKAALPYMIEQGAGTIINVGSAGDGPSIPLQAIHGAIHRVITGLTEGLRREFWKKSGDFHVTHIAPPEATALPPRPGAANGADEGRRPQARDPRIIAESIVVAAQHPRRNVGDGGGARFLDVMERISPAFADWLHTGSDESPREQGSDPPTAPPDESLDPSSPPRRARGTPGGETQGTNLYSLVFDRRPGSSPDILGFPTKGHLEGRKDPFGGMN